VRRSGSFPAILVIAGATAVACAGLAAPAAAAPHELQAVAGPAMYGFGTNQLGELGNGTTTATPSLTPMRASGPPGTVRQLATGLHSAGALLTDGTVWTWGQNYYHQLGYNTSNTVVTTPQQVPGLSGITQIGLSDEGNGYAVGTAGNVWAWGDNSHGQLGNGTTSASNTPILVPGLNGVTQVSAGPYYVLALKSDGTVWAWGDNADGSLGDGTTTDRLRPVHVPGLTGITQVVAADASFAVRSDGALFSWGLNSLGQLGNGTTGTNTAHPAAVPGLTGVTQVASSGASALAIAGTAERVWAWGGNSCGQLGDGTTTGRNTPELIGMVGATQITMGIFGILIVSSAAIRYDGTLWTWGCNGWGQLANGTTLATRTPTLVTSLNHVSQFVFGDDSPTLFNVGAYSLAVGTLPATVPSLSGDTTAQASQALQAAGLVLGTVSSVIDYSCNNLGTVTSQNPPAGTSVNPGTAVAITIGKAPPPPHQCP
jgi:alpha-tubulin suppressor-like RCC1 family protein